MSTTVSGKLENLGQANVTIGTFVRFYLRGAGGNQPRVNGTALIAPTLGNVYYFDFVPNASGIISGTLWSTRDSTGLLGGDIEVGGVTTAVWYGMVVYSNGKAGPETPIHAKNTATFDISNVTPITTNPVVTAPTGDSTYARLDGGNQPFTGALTAPNINGVIAVTTLTCAGLQSSLALCSTAGGGVVDARGIITSQACSSTITVPANCTLLVNPLATFTSSSAPTICVNNASAIIGGPGELSAGNIASFQNSNGGNSVLAACTVNPRTTDVFIQGIDFWNTNGTVTVPVLDLTGFNRGRFDNVAVQHSSTGTNSTGPLVLITPATGTDAFYNVFTTPKFQGNGGSGPGFKLTATAASGANSNSVVGGSLSGVGDCYLIDGTNAQVNQFSVFGTACEEQSAAVFHTIGNVASIGQTGGRMESHAALATIFNLSAGTVNVQLTQVGEFGTQTCGTTFSNFTIVGWPTGSPCITSGIDVFSSANISGNAYIGQNSGVTSTFTNNVNANAIASFTSNATGNGNGVQWINSAASGHTWQGPYELNTVGVMEFRDLTQAGQPSWGADVLGATSGRMRNRYNQTANRDLTWMNQGGTPVLQVGAILQKAETGADASLLSVTPLAFAGTYRACISMAVSAQSTATLGWTATWTDSNGSAQAPTNLALQQTGVAAPALTFTAATNGNYYGCATLDINNAAVAIVVKTTFSGTSIAYKASATVERLE